MIKIYLPLLILIFSLQGCIVPQFAEPQPAGLKNKSSFPEKLRGSYRVSLMSAVAKEDDNSSIYIDSTHLHLYEVKKAKAALSDVKADSSIQLIGGYIYIEEDGNTKINPYQLLNDTVYYIDSNKVELNLNTNCVLREWKGHYFLNHKRDRNWDVLMMDAVKENSYVLQALILTEKMDPDELFSDPNDIPIDSFYYNKKTPPPTQSKPKKEEKQELTLEDLGKITSWKKDNDDYVIKPSRSQLQKLIKKKFFKEVWRMEKIK